MKYFIFCLGLVIAVPVYAGDPAQAVIDCIRTNVPPTVRVQQIELSTVDHAGNTRTLKGRLFAMAEKQPAGGTLLRTMLRIDAPVDLAGAAYLVREQSNYLKDGMYVYLPTVKRVRRVTGEFADGALLGTSFSYYDFKELENALGDFNGKLEAPEQIDGRKVNVISFQPRAGVKSTYSTVRAWVDEKTCVPLKAAFYEGANVRKQMSASPGALQQSGKYWYLSEVEMRDLKNDAKSTLRILNVSGGKELPSRYFNAATFYEGAE